MRTIPFCGCAADVLPCVFVIMAALLSSCAETLPRVGSALQAAKDGYTQVETVRAKVQDARDRICLPTPIVADAGPMCAETAAGLVQAESASRVAREALNTAIELYTAANEAVQ